MTIKHVVLGMLNQAPQTGYNLKKLVAASPLMPWSGNSNQIYTALTELLQAGLVANQVLEQASLPAKKLYHITESGQAELKRWLLSEPAPPEFKKIFLLQLTLAQSLSDAEIAQMLGNYQNIVELELLMAQAAKPPSQQSARQQQIWQAINSNVQQFYQNELDWLAATQKDLNLPPLSPTPAAAANEPNAAALLFQSELINQDGVSYLKIRYSGHCLETAAQVLYLVEASLAAPTNLLLIEGKLFGAAWALPGNSLAALLGQKLASYQIKTALLKAPKQAVVASGNCRNFSNPAQAVAWLSQEVPA